MEDHEALFWRLGDRFGNLRDDPDADVPETADPPETGILSYQQALQSALYEARLASTNFAIAGKVKRARQSMIQKVIGAVTAIWRSEEKTSEELLLRDIEVLTAEMDICVQMVNDHVRMSQRQFAVTMSAPLQEKCDRCLSAWTLLKQRKPALRGKI